MRKLKVIEVMAESNVSVRVCAFGFGFRLKFID